MRFLVTTGPTREHIDAVRFISNPSSGRMGYAVAVAATEAGHTVTVIAGPTAATPPNGMEIIPVTSTVEMLHAAQGFWEVTDAFVAAAAPCDFRPAQRLETKLKKQGNALDLRLAPNPDVLYELSRQKEGRVLVGFAMEAQDARANARAKLQRKNLDAIVLNSPAAFGAERSSVTIFTVDDGEDVRPDISKSNLAAELVQLVERIWESRQR